MLAAFTLLLAGGYFAIQNSRVQTYLTQLFADQLSKQIHSKITVGKVKIAFFNKVILNDVLVEDQKSDTLFYTHKLSAKIDTLKIRKKHISIDELSLVNNKINIERDSATHFNFTYILNAFRTQKDTSGFWQISCNNFSFYQSGISYSDLYSQEKQTMYLNNINFDLSDFQLQPDSVLFKINDLKLNDRKNLFINSLSANFAFFKNNIHVDSLFLKTNDSEIQNTSVNLDFGENGERSLESTEFDIRFSDSNISFLEIAQLIPSLKGMDMKVNLSGEIYGNQNDLKGKNVVIKTGENTSAFFDFYMNDLTDVENMYLFVDLKLSKTNFSDISQIKLPLGANIRHLSFPEPFYNAGTITYRGNFSGFLTDFVAFGTFSSKVGTLTTDISVIPQAEGSIKYRGKINTRNFELGELFKIEDIGKITFNGNVDGIFHKNSNKLSGKFNGFISELEAYDYTYQNIALDGTLDNKMFDGMLLVNDPNLKFDFTGRVNFNPAVPEFDFNLHLDKALPGKLNLSSNFPASEMAFNMAANFKGDKLDNLEGFIMIEDGFYKNRNGQFKLNGMELNSVHTDTANVLTFNSDFFNIKVSGKYHFQSIIDAFRKNANYYLPATNYERLAQAKDNIFEYQIDVNNLDTLTAIFIPNYKVETPFLLYGKLDSENTLFELEGSIPGIATKNLLAKNIFIGNKPKGDEYASKFRFGEVMLKNGMSLYNLTFDSKISDDVIENQISWANSGALTYSGTIKTKTTFSKTDDNSHPLVTIEGLPSKIFIADSVWQISPFTATIDSTAIEIKDFRFFNNSQQITIDGKVSEDKSNILSAKFENINLGYIEEYLDKEFGISGILNGSAGIFDFYNQKMILSDVGVTDFRFNNQEIGDIVFTNYWNNAESIINSELEVKNSKGKQRLHAEGNYNPSAKTLDYDILADSLSVVLLETVLEKNFSDIHGFASGNIKLHGTPEKILFDGAMYGSNAGLTIDYTQVDYSFSDSVYFKGDTILFDNITIFDGSSNKGTFNGTLVHTNFHDMVYNLTMSSPKILALNTQPHNNEQFYGKMFANGRLSITGFRRDVVLNGSGTTLPGTSVNIMLDGESEIEQYDFIQFVSEDKPEEPKFYFANTEEEEGDFQMNLTIRATPDARAQIIYNSQIGDVIKAQGEGILLFGMDNEGDITLSGNYTVERGDYLFTLKNVINKRFTIEQGGTLVWSGDPYNADINLNAVYKAKASLYDLLFSSYDINQSQRVPVECKIMLTDELSNPDIHFEIDFPTVEERVVDELQQYFSTDEEMNKQILSLLVLGKFYTPEYLRGTFEAQNPNVIGTTASELFSNQLSNWLSQISNVVDVGFNYRPGNQITNDEIELALSTQMFNDRVTINGNIGNNANPNSTNNSQLVGDFDINVKLIPSGKVQLKAYNRSNNNIFYETAPYTQGVGFSIQEDYNTLDELLKKMGSLFRKKEDSEQ